MKKVLLFLFCVFCFFACTETRDVMVVTGGGHLSKEKLKSLVEAEKKKEATINVVEKKEEKNKEPFLEGVKILLENGTWGKIQQTKVNNLPVLQQRWYGHGPSVQLKLPQAGKLVEKNRDYCVKWDNDTDECTEEKDVILRSRNIEANKSVRVAANAYIYLNEYLVMEPLCKLCAIAPEEITDPEWQPTKIEKRFKSLAELRKFAEKNRYWMIIGGPKSAPLYGWMHEVPVYELFYKKRVFLVFGVDMKKIAKPEWPTGEWDPTHIKYRYLGIYLGGHDTSWGPGCISIFGFPKGANTDDLDPIMMVQLAKDGTIFWYDEKKPEFALETLQ